MKRKVIKQGHNTLTITLPSEWVKKLNIEPGDELDLNDYQGSLLINGKQHNGHKSTSIDINGLNIPMIWRFFQSAYREGYDEIKLIYNPHEDYESAYNFYSSQFAYKGMGEKGDSKKTGLEMLEGLINRFIGMEIIDNGNNYCTIKEMGDLTSKEFDSSLRRIFLLIEELFEKMLSLIENNQIGDIKVCKTIHAMDINIDRFIDYCCRINNKINDSSFQKNKPVLFATLFLLELLGDEFKYVGVHLSKAKKSVKDVLPFAKAVKNHYDMYYKLFYKFDKAGIIAFGENDFNIYNEHFKGKDMDHPELRSIRRHFMQMSKFIFCLMELRIEMEY
jgi:phosphate uptake regulator